MIELEKLRHAVAVARAGSYSAAARDIRVAQSALTRSINLLEAKYGVRLFDRGRSGARLTLAGVEFIGIAEEALRTARTAHEQLTGLPTTAVPLVRFGMGPMTAASLLPELLPLLRDNVRYRMKVLGNGALTLLLRRGELDFFLGGMRKGDEFHTLANDFSVEPIATAAMNLLVRPGHPLLALPPTPAAIAAFPTAGGSFVRETFGFAAISRYGLQPPNLELDDYQMLMSLVLESDHILICNQMLARTKLGARLVPLGLTIDIADQSSLAIVSLQRGALTDSVLESIESISRLICTQVSRAPVLDAA